MTLEHIQDNLVIERYLAGQLNSVEAEEFEARLLWDQALQDEFELTRRLREGIRGIQQSAGAVAPVLPAPAPVQARPHFAFAASLLVAVGTGALLSQLTMRPLHTDPVSTVEVYKLDTLRNTPGPGNLPVIVPGEDGSWLTLLAYPNTTGRDTFRAELSVEQANGSWAGVWQGKPVSGLRDNTLGVTIRSDILVAGTYRLTVRGWSGQAQPTMASEHYFRVPAR